MSSRYQQNNSQRGSEMGSVTRREFLRSTVGAAGAILALRSGDAVCGELSVFDRISEAIPKKALVRPAKPRKLLIFDRNVGYGGHGSIQTANLAFKLMGEKTGAFETTVSKDPSIFERSSLGQFDAVFFNNTVGNLFEDKTLRRNLVEFVYSGGGLMGVHGTSVAFTVWPGAHEDWPEFGVMLGARGASHRESTEHVYVKLDDPGHPVNGVFGGKDFEYRDEHFRFQDVYSRRRVRVLMSIDTKKTDMAQGRELGRAFREDNDYALAWVRRYGRGRVFYCTIAHNPYVFWDAVMLRFYLAATQFALGDLTGPTTPSALLTPAVRAQEKLGWRIGLINPTPSMTDLMDNASVLGLLNIGACKQQVSPDSDLVFAPGLSSEQMETARLKLDSAGVGLVTYNVGDFPADESRCRKLFEFGRSMGIEAFVGKPSGKIMDCVEKLCDEYEIKLAIADIDDRKQVKHIQPEYALKLCRGRSKRIGVYGDLTEWAHSGVDSVEAIRVLGDRLMVLQLHNRSVERITKVLGQVHKMGVKPVMFSIEDGDSGTVKSFGDICMRLAE